MDWMADPDLEDPNPDVWELFRHYDGLYFRGALAGAGFAVQWSSPSMIGHFGSCTFRKLGNTITLSEPVLKYRTNADLKNALLHMMIHAILYVKLDRKDRWNHGPIFRAWMDAINSCSFDDHQRPPGGYNITTRHDFSPEESCSIHGFLWKCESCGDTLVRATQLGPPSDACCIENVDNDATCGNMLCCWHNHKMKCGDTYANAGMVTKPRETPGRKKVMKGTQRLLTDTSEMSKSQRTVRESDSAELQENATVRKPNAEGKLLFPVGGKNAKSLGSGSSKKAGKRRSPEDVQKASVLPAALSKLKVKQGFVGLERHELFSLVGCNDANSPGSTTSEKARKRHRPENVLKSSVPPVSPRKKPDLVASQKHKVSCLVGYSNAKPPGISTSNEVGKEYKPEGVEIYSVLFAAPQKELKLNQDLAASGKNEVSSLVGYSRAKPPGSSSTSNKAGKQHKPGGVQKACSLLGSSSPKKAAGKQHEPEDIQKTIALPVAPRSKLKKANETSSSNKAGKQHKPEDIQKTVIMPTLKQDLVASQDELYSVVGCGNAKVLESSCKRQARKQHEPDDTRKTIALPATPQSKLKQPNGICSSFKADKQHYPEDIQKTIFLPAAPQSEPKQANLVASVRQKRKCKTRKSGREKEFAVMSAWLNYYESEGSSGSVEPLANKRTEQRKRARNSSNQTTYSRSRKLCTRGGSSIMTQPPADESSQQSEPRLPCLGLVVICPADQVVTQAPGDQSQPPAPCLDIVDVASADQMVPLQSTDPPGLTPSNPSIGPDVIDISDDD